MPTDLRPITERQCFPEGLSLSADLRWRVRYCSLGMRLLGPRRPGLAHPPCRWCGFYADAAPAPPFDTTVVEVLLAGAVRRVCETSSGRQQTLHGVWLPGWCGPPDHPGFESYDGFERHGAPAAFVGGFGWVDCEGRTEALSLCGPCAEDWRYGTMFDPDDLARRLGAPIRVAAVTAPSDPPR